MSTTDIKQVVKEKYGQAATRVQSGKSTCCGGPSSLEACCDPITSKLYSAEEGANLPAGSASGIVGLRKSNRARATERRRDGARPWLRRRHRRAALRAARRADRQGVRPRHDRRDARPRARKPEEGRRGERRVSERRDREHPAPGQLRGRHHLQLRDQSCPPTRTVFCARHSAF